MYKAQHPLGVELNKLILHMNDNNKQKMLPKSSR